MHEFINKVPDRVVMLSLIPKDAAKRMAKKSYREEIYRYVPVVVQEFLAQQFRVASEADGLMYAYYTDYRVQKMITCLLMQK